MTGGRINSGLATVPPLLSDDEAEDVYASLGAVVFEQPGDGFIYAYAYTARGQRVQNVVPADAPADRVVAAAAMVWRRRAAWDRLQAVRP